MRLEFTVLGEPQGKGRPRFARYGNQVTTRTPEKTVVYENLVRLEYERQCRGKCFDKDVPLEIIITAYYTIPKSASKKRQTMMLEGNILPTKKPDWDNIGKVIADSLNGVAYHDDAQIVDGRIKKFFSERPRVEVVIQETNINGKRYIRERRE